MRRHLMGALALAIAVGTAACDDTFTVPNLNNPNVDDITENPDIVALQAAAQGLEVGMRFFITGQTGLIPHLGLLGRESLTFDNSDPRFITEMTAGSLDPGSGAFGGSNWLPRYQVLKTGRLLLDAVDVAPVNDDLTEARKEAFRGFAKTIMALQYLQLVSSRWENGIVWDIVDGPDSEPAPLIGKDEALGRISALLDEAAAHLAGASPSFPFGVTPGLSDFGDPASFIEANRALKARVEAYRGDYAAVQTALAGSFLAPGGDLGLGIYYDYSGSSGDTPNGLFTGTIGSTPNMMAHPSIRADAQMQPSGDLDARALQKTEVFGGRSSRGLSTNLRLAIHPTIDSPVPIIRNEELLLLRAEARWFTGDREGALEDLNEVRTRAGGLAPLSLPLTNEEFVDALLYERRYSLFMEGGHRWIDARRFDRLDGIPVDRATDVVPDAFPIPRSECLVRGLTVPCSA